MDLAKLIEGLPVGSNEDVIVGFEASDDASVYRLTNDTAIVQTADYITPMTDDPYLFGQLAAANALSDVYAMGGRPITAINLCNFPGSGIPMDVFRQILDGGVSKVKEAGAIVVGGHTIKDDDLKYGLSVTGLVHPDKIVRNDGAKPGDVLILTKPIGTGILYNGAKKGAVDSFYLDGAIKRNVVLNRHASELMVEHGANAATDITGFGLLGHLKEMVQASYVRVEVSVDMVPLFEKAYETAERGFRPGMSEENLRSVEKITNFSAEIEDAMKWLLVDPQTSGGLLISIEEEKAEGLTTELRKGDAPESTVIGRIIEKGEASIVVERQMP